jgi:hypothetical protein
MTYRHICITGVLLAALSTAACEEHFDATGAYPGSLTIRTMNGDGQRGVAQSWLSTDLHVQVLHTNTQDPVAGVVVLWRVVSGSDAQLETPSSVTDANGVARMRVRLGASADYVIEASFAGLRSKPARFTVHAATP